MGNSERVEGQESLHTAGGPTDYLWSATVSNKFVYKIKIHILYAVKLFENRAVYVINWKNIVEPAGHR